MSLDLLSLMDDAGHSQATPLSPPATYPLYIPPGKAKTSISVHNTPTTSPERSRAHSRRSTGSTVFGTEPPPASAPSMASVFPRFSHADVNALLYLCVVMLRALADPVGSADDIVSCSGDGISAVLSRTHRRVGASTTRA